MGVSRRAVFSSRKSQRAQRKREAQEQRLVIRHRWYAGGVATVLSAALIFSGMSPALADDVVAPDPATTQATRLRCPRAARPCGCRSTASATQLASRPLAGATFVAYASTARRCAQRRCGGHLCDLRRTAVRAGSCPTAPAAAWEHPGLLGVRDGRPGGWNRWATSVSAPTTMPRPRRRTRCSPTTSRVTARSTSSPRTRHATSSVARHRPPDRQQRLRGHPREPDVPGELRLSIAMVFDTSLSINSSEWTSMKNAALNFVGASGLGGSPSQVAMYRFSTTASKILNLTSIAANQTAASAINGLPASGDGYTTGRRDAQGRVQRHRVLRRRAVPHGGDPTVNGTAAATKRPTSASATSRRASSRPTQSEHDRPCRCAHQGRRDRHRFATNSDLSRRSRPDRQRRLLHDELRGPFGQAARDRARELRWLGHGRQEDRRRQRQHHRQPGRRLDLHRLHLGRLDQARGTVERRLARSDHAEHGTSEGAVNFPVDLSGATTRTLTVAETVQSGFTPDSVSCTGATPTGTAASFSVTRRAERNHQLHRRQQADHRARSP